MPRAQIMAGCIEVIGYQVLWNGNRGDDRVVFIHKTALPAIRARSNVD
ncbi:hypothetical protein [Dactylosporangium sp. CA-233914]